MKKLLKKWNESYLRLIINFIASIYLGYTFTQNPLSINKLVFTMVGVIFIVEAICFLNEIFFKWHISRLKKYKN